MKYLILFLIPTLVLSQEFDLPDTLFFKSGDQEDCFIRFISERQVNLSYAVNVNAHASIEKISRIYIEGMGFVYQSEKGFITPLNEVNSFLSSRQPAPQKEGKLVRVPGSVSSKKGPVRQLPVQERLSDLKWVFGMFYVPYHEYNQKVFSHGLAGSNVFNVENAGAMSEVHWGYQVYQNLFLTVHTGYNQVSVETHFEATEEFNGTSGYDQQDKIKTLSILIGGKYFLIFPQPGFVAPYLVAGAGKQFAFVTERYDSFYEGETSTVTVDENREEFLEDINSPLLIELGFGTEYLFNKSISLFAQIILDYASVSAVHRYRRETEFEENSSKFEYDHSEMFTRIGFGLNFYF